MAYDIHKGDLESTSDFIEKLEHLLRDYSDEVPPYDISSKVTKQRATHKVQHNWWTILILTLEVMNYKLSLPQQFQSRIRNFVNIYTSKDFRRKPRTSEEDIHAANTFISTAIKELLKM